MSATVSSSSPRSPVSRQTRQRVVMLYAGGLGLVSLVSLLGLTLPPQGTAWVLALALYALGLGLTLYSSWQLARPALLGLPQGHSPTLNERQTGRLAQAMSASYRILSVLLVLALLGFVLLSGEAMNRLRDSAVGGGLAFVFLFLLPILPNAVLAWTEPDIEPDREEPDREE